MKPKSNRVFARSKFHQKVQQEGESFEQFLTDLKLIVKIVVMVVCGLSLHQGSTESRKTLEQKFIFQIGTLNPHGINERFSFN